MPRLRLYCQEAEDYDRLAPYRDIILSWLGDATADALGLKGRSGVDLILLPYVRSNANRLELECRVSRGKTPKQDMNEWAGFLASAWRSMLEDPDLQRVHDILADTVGIWPVVVDGLYLPLRNGQPAS